MSDLIDVIFTPSCALFASRLYPAVINLSRIVTEDLVLGGYHVPAKVEI